ncbi:hypothetical protein LguiA_002354 [Lonicera macranthoides]
MNIRDESDNSNTSKITDVQSLQFDLRTIQAATNNFSYENKIGEGGFGMVYKGTLANGQEIAVKRLSKGSGQGAKEFKNEVVLVAKLQHRNLVMLLGFCLDRDEKILVYEYVLNKSLDYFLFDLEKQGQLNWSIRYKIIGGIARGMLYLHEDSRPRIIHRDLKASNILLDAKMNAKVSDFGIAKIFGVDQTQGNTSRIVGTLGYMCPEYAMHGLYSVRSDVFSFGVLVLEIISGKKNSSFCQSDHGDHLLSHAWRLWKDGTPLDFMDPTLASTYSRNEVERCIHMGLLCVQEDADARPSMATIVQVLSNYSITLPLPEQPPFFFRNTTESYSRKSAMVSVDEASITQAPQASKQAPQQATQADGPPDSVQESPVLPLVLPLPSAHSTTGSTGPSPPTRSIRCSFATTHVPTDTDTATGASSSNKRRGVVLGKKTAAITKEKGRTPVTYEDSIRGPPFSVRSRFVTDLSAYIKDRCPMLHPTWHDLPVTERTRLLDFLSVNYDIDHRRRELTGWIDEKAANRFRQWKSSCHKNWQELGDTPLPVELAHRPAEWQWLCNHFRDPEFQAERANECDPGLDKQEAPQRPRLLQLGLRNTRRKASKLLTRRRT